MNDVSLEIGFLRLGSKRGGWSSVFYANDHVNRRPKKVLEIGIEQTMLEYCKSTG